MVRPIWLMASLMVLLHSCEETPPATNELNYKAHIFYYSWYGSPEHDGAYSHWDHEILPHWSDTTWNNMGSFSGGDDIGANFYPELGCYSSADTALISQHMDMIVEAGIGVFVISWWGKDGYDDRSITHYLGIAATRKLRMAFHIEPFYRSAVELKEQLDYLATNYGQHPALYRVNDQAFYYVYDSYKLPVSEWQKLLSVDGELSVRNTTSDGTFIGLWVEEDEHGFFLNADFDGFYTYFASEGFVFGSTPSNWPSMADFAQKNDLLFIPCAGPGYLDTRIRPWNSSNTKKRKHGMYYERMFHAAVQTKPPYIGITSFNEWHEGTQIEPAVPHSIKGYNYANYGEGVDPWFYIHLTKALTIEF